MVADEDDEEPVGEEFSIEDLMRKPPHDWTKSYLLPQFDSTLPIERQALHAAELAIDHPISGMAISFEAPLPADMEAALSALRERELSLAEA